MEGAKELAARLTKAYNFKKLANLLVNQLSWYKMILKLQVRLWMLKTNTISH
jgi:hypothetical protein